MVGPPGYHPMWDDVGDYYDKDTTPITFRRWVELLEEHGWEYKRVALDEIGIYRVSTVWLGLNHGWGAGPPLIFETMVFLEDTPTDMGMYRYSTLAEALAGHEAVCAEIRVGEEDTRDRHPSNRAKRGDDEPATE